MKRRLALVVLVTGVVVLTGAMAAFAKGPLSVTINGPGIDRSIDLLEVGHNDPVLDLMQESALWGGLRSTSRLPAKPQVELGPAYTVAWVNSVPPGDSPGERVITQTVYPFAEIGPVIHTPSQVGLTGWGPDVVGWFGGPERLADTLVALGAPPPPVDNTPAPAIDQDRVPVDDDGPGRMVWAPLIGLLVIAGIGWAARRRRAAPAQ